ncbi:hypothetical protein LMF32_04515 [Desemzia sp. C1]|uniref:hypothetical protein n=1 Tax=Desemzia sp. C1 TaxID=2892016 RepID=UPI001E3302DD|nr:hypothetical protein [Desemzia sp. C1]MCI3028366.1 hypothetical protein [Desemzia sp. C1]
MKTRTSYSMLFLSLLLPGCRNESEESHNKSIQNEEGTQEEITNVKGEEEAEVDDEGTNNEEKTIAYTYDNFKGTYAFFEDVPYESPIQYAFTFMDDYYVEGLKDSSYSVNEISNKEVIENVLQFDYFAPEGGGNGAVNGNLELELVEKNSEQTLFFPETGSVIYPITEQDLIEEGWKWPSELEILQAEKETQQESVEDSSSSADIIEAYNELDIALKVLLAATTVDERAMTPELLGFNLYYNFDGDTLLVNIHSGAGVGHPWYAIKYDKETITPVEGVVYNGSMGYEDASVDPTSVSKIDLYNRYIESKQSYDLAVENNVEYPEMTLSEYEDMRSEIE